MIYLKLHQAGEIVNHKRVYRLYAQAGLQVKKRRRKKIALTDRHLLQLLTAANQVWSMDFVFDRTAEGCSIKNLTVVDDATHEAVAIVPEPRWPVQIPPSVATPNSPRQGRWNYDGSLLMASRLAASLSL